MSRRIKDNILQQAKEQRAAELNEAYESAYNAYLSAKQDGILSEAELDSLFEAVDEAATDLEEWRQRRNKNKRKLSRRVDWVAERRATANNRTVDLKALAAMRERTHETSRHRVGVDWLHEGALVTRRDRNDMMIVTAIQGQTVVCLLEGRTVHLGALSLRPAEWNFED